MPKTFDPNRPMKRGEKIISANPLPGVPEGTRGRVKVVNGFEWIRYWIFFENGIALGSVDHGDVVRQKEWERFKIQRIADREAAADAAERAASGESALPSSEAAAESDGGAADSFGIPAHLLERSRLARDRFGA